MTTKRIPIPLTFFVIVAAIIFLIIFFGAWAVSADASDRDRALSFGFVASRAPLDATATNSAQLSGGAAVNQEDGVAGGDSWWQKAFLKACPLH